MHVLTLVFIPFLKGVLYQDSGCRQSEDENEPGQRPRDQRQRFRVEPEKAYHVANCQEYPYQQKRYCCQNFRNPFVHVYTCKRRLKFVTR